MQVTMTAAERQQAAETWPRIARAVPRAANGTAQGGHRADRRAGNGLEPGSAGDRGGAVAQSLRPLDSRRRTAAVIRRRHRLRAGDAAFAVDRIAATHVGAVDEHLSRSHRTARREDPLSHHAHPGSRARPRTPGRCRDRVGQVPRPASWHPVRREGPARHQGHPHHLRRRALPQPRACGRRDGRAQAGRGGRGADRQALARRAGAQRHLVRRADHEPVADRRGRLGLERRARRGDGGGARRLLDWQRDGREHRQSRDALRRDGPASHVRPRPAHRIDDALLVARQARTR